MSSVTGGCGLDRLHSSVRGAALVDVVFTGALIMVVAGMTVPPLHAARDRSAVRTLTRALASELQLARSEALRRNRMVAVRFDPATPGATALYADGDGDGVQQRDIDGRVDVLLSRSSVARNAGAVAASIGIGAAIPAPDGSGLLASGSDPLRIGAGNLLSFSPLGSATSGTIYVTGQSGLQMCVRVFGATGRIRTLRFDRPTGAWQPA